MGKMPRNAVPETGREVLSDKVTECVLFCFNDLKECIMVGSYVGKKM